MCQSQTPNFRTTEGFFWSPKGEKHIAKWCTQNEWPWKAGQSALGKPGKRSIRREHWLHASMLRYEDDSLEKSYGSGDMQRRDGAHKNNFNIGLSKTKTRRCIFSLSGKEINVYQELLMLNTLYKPPWIPFALVHHKWWELVCSNNYL